jgi:hypothetical protein
VRQRCLQAKPTIAKYAVLSHEQRLLIAILTSLHRHQIEIVEINYNGHGDEGHISDPGIIKPDIGGLTIWLQERVFSQPLITPFGGTIGDSDHPEQYFGLLSIKGAIDILVNTQSFSNGGNWHDGEGGGGTATIYGDGDPV